MKNRRPTCDRAFTIVELLVTITIIGLLAALLLPALGRSKEQAKLTHCLSNLHQVGAAFEMYRDDQGDRFPEQAIDWTAWQYGGGDPSWTKLQTVYPDVDLVAATNRPLWIYIRTPEVFHCPADRGEDVRPLYPVPFVNLFGTIGTSYVYNYTPLRSRTKEPLADPENGLAGKLYSWVPEPARHILLFEPAALPDDTEGPQALYVLWHYNSGNSTVHSPSEIRQKVVSPVLFVDGHAAVYDFSATVKSQWPAEPTANWVWYKPAPLRK
jgi:prepilin-type N-terminal cleavage/methylation domain-containing protein/prepilin-type processing-associated H-X9-DG protein